MADHLNMLLLNIRSLRNKLYSLQLFLSELSREMNEEYDIIALVESWVRRDEAPYLKIQGYDMLIQERDGKKSGGVILYCRDSLSMEISERFATTFNSLHFKYKNTDSKTLTGLLVYRFCNSNKDTFIKELENEIDNLSSNAIVFGDMNIDLLKQNDSKQYIGMLTTKGFISCLNTPTRICPPSVSCIDHVFIRHRLCKNPISISNCKAISTDLSDHKAISFRINSIKSIKEQNKNRPETKTVNWSLVNENLSKEQWSSIISSPDVNSAFELFVEKLQNTVQRSTITRRRIGNLTQRMPWASLELMKISKEKNKMYKLLKEYPSSTFFRDRYKILSREVKLKTANDKKHYYGTLLEKCGSDPKKYWAIIQQASGRVKEPMKKIRLDGTMLEVKNNEEEIAGAFNKYFIGVTKAIASSFPSTASNNHPLIYAGKTSTNSFYCAEITPTDVAEAIRYASNKKSTGSDGLSIQLFKSCSENLVQPLAHLFNKSLESGIFPTNLKQAIVVPVPKGGVNAELNNYRPIALLSIISKIFEIIVKKQILHFLLSNNFFGSNQFGFLPKKSTDDALLQHIKKITLGVDSGQPTAAVYLDISKAFDTVDHNILALKLERCGIRGSILNWFKSYLSDRTQSVEIGSVISGYEKLVSGVPQGSTLGPVLFLIYVNDLASLPLTGSLFSFADDTALVYSSQTKSELIANINSDLNTVTNWFYAHKLHVNLTKTKFLTFSYSKPLKIENSLILHSSPYCSSSCNCKYLEQVNEIRYLGLMINSTLNWSSHCIYMQRRLQSLNSLLYHASQKFELKHLIRIYVALYEPVLRYGILHWGGAPKVWTKPLQKLQKRAIRTIAHLRYGDGSQTKMKQLGLLNLKCLHWWSSSSYVHRHHNTYGIKPRSEHQLRDRGITLILPSWSKERSKTQSSYQPPFIYNNLPLYIRQINHYKAFNNAVKNHLINHLM